MSEGPPRVNALAGESSPYLLLHKENPVDWYPWGEAALARSREEGKPIFLSVGYSTCYWCHVMERESFASPEIAALMNEHFINIKVDREERPDLDEIYMVATQVLNEQGGWPNSVFLTPELKPFFAGTYFPPRDRKDRPGFTTVLTSLADAWVDRRDDIEEQGESVIGAIRHYLEERDPPTETLPGAEPAERSVRALERQYDPMWGGFGNAPKFPSVPNLWLLEEFADEGTHPREMLETTLDRMARGGIYDQLGGGFHRYSTDQEWTVPHFEKMLYDNGLLLGLYARDFERSGSEQSARIVRETAAFLAREMRSEEGAFWSAIDAETDGHEGRYYVWKQAELIEILTRENAAFLAPFLGFQGGPFFEKDYFVLHWPETLERQAERRQVSPEELFAEVRPMLDQLLAVRGTRKRPLTDDKILADWNGMAIAGLAEAGRVLEDSKLVTLAADAAAAVLEHLRSPGGVLLHSWRKGEGRVEAFLSDYAFLVHGLLALSRATGESSWRDRAVELVDEQESRLASSEGGYYAAAENDDLVVRSRDVYDGALPAANAVAVGNLLELATQTGEERWRERAARALCAHGALVRERPEAARTLALVARRASALGLRPEASVETAAEAPSESVGGVAEEIASLSLRLGVPTAEAPEAVYPFELEVRIADGWHLQANDSGVSEAAAMGGFVLEAEDVLLSSVEYPEGAVRTRGGADADPGAARSYEGRVTISGVLTVSGPTPRLHLHFQPCDDQRCLEPTSVEIDVEIPR